MSPPDPPARTTGPLLLLLRGVLVRCPACGGGGLFRNWFKIRDRCPTCGFLFARGESGYQLGSMALDLVIPMVIWFLAFFATLYLTWPTPPWVAIQWGSVAFMIAAPLLLYPMSHTLAIALDLWVRPPDRHERERGRPTPR